MAVYRKAGSPYWWYSFTHKGRRVFASTGATDHKVAKLVYLRERNRAIERRATGELAPIKLRDLCNRFLNDYSKPNKRSYKADTYIVNCLNAFFGDRLASDVTAHGVEQFKAHRRQTFIPESEEGRAARQISGARINRELSLLKTIYNKGVEWGLVESNPVDRVKFFSEKGRARTRYLTADEKKSLLEVCPPALRRIVIVALKTGMRRGEIFGLKWSDVDFHAGQLTLKRTKSGETRFIPMHRDVRDVLTSLPRSGDYVFEGDRGGTSWHGALRVEWDKAVHAAALLDFVFHDLRHTFASELVMRGVDLLTVSKLLGHSTTRITERYAHLAPAHKAVAINMLASEPSAPLATPKALQDLRKGVSA